MIAKRIAASVTVLCTLLCTASVVIAEDNDPRSEKTIELMNQNSVFNHVVVTNPELMPEDLKIEYSDDDGATWTEFEYNVNNEGVMGYIYGGSGDGLISGSQSGNFCTYREYTADKIKISSASADVEQLIVGVYNAQDVAPTAKQIKDNNSLITAVGDNGVSLFMEETYNGNRLNNTSNTNPAYLYNADINGNILHGTGGTDNKTGSVIINLGDEKIISKIGFGDMIGSEYLGKNKFLGDRFAAYFNKDGVWQLIDEVDNNTDDTKFNHATINSAKVRTDKIKLTFTFNGNSNGAALPNLEQGAAKPVVQAIRFSYIGIYDFGENLIYQDYSYPSDSVSLGENTVTFNTIAADDMPESYKWQYSENDSDWTDYHDGDEVSAKYIRIISKVDDPVVPRFALKWRGNLVKYAANGINGASAAGAGGDRWDTITDGNYGESIVLTATDNTGDITFDFKAPAKVYSMHGYYGSGCWYPQEYAVEMSNKGNIWIRAASEKFMLRLNSNREHPTSEAVHYSQFDCETSFKDAEAAMMRIKYRGSMRAVCDNNDTIHDIRISELVINGSVEIADYDGDVIAFNVPDSDPPKITRESVKVFVDGVEQDIEAGAVHIYEGEHEFSAEIVTEKGNGAAYLAVYEDGVLKSVGADNNPESDGYSSEYNAALTYTVPLSHPTLEIKLLFWDKSAVEPLCEPVVIKELLFTYPKSENNSMFREGDVVGFIGDSITHADNMNTPNYMSFIYGYYITRMPNEPIKLVNVGIASYTAGDVLNTFDENVAVGGIRKKDGSAWANINKATLMIGMNDINRGLYYKNSIANNAEQRQAKIDESNRNTRLILSKLNEIGVENNDITLITPSIFDNTKVSNATSSNPCLANDGLVILAEMDKELAAEKGTSLVEFNAPMLEINKTYQARNYDGTIIRDDLVHPRGMGHTMMGYLFLRGQGADGDVAVADLVNEEYTNCDVDIKEKDDSYIEYTYTPKSIPLAASSDYNAANEYVDITNDLNREIIKANLRGGKYKLSIDGVELGTYTDKDFRNGVNIATLSKNPNQIVSQEIEKLNIERRNNEIRIRNTWFQEFNKDKISYMNWVNIVSSEVDGRMVADPDYQEKDEYKNATQSEKNSMDTYAEVKLNPDKFTDAIDSCIAEMYAKAQQAVKTPRTVRIERAE